jgi:hypothetical protein
MKGTESNDDHELLFEGHPLEVLMNMVVNVLEKQDRQAVREARGAFCFLRGR